jgi:hypothetical protein
MMFSAIVPMSSLQATGADLPTKLIYEVVLGRLEKG